MSQGIWDTIIPSTTSGNQLATLLNDFKNAVVSGFSGTSRPSQLQIAGYWIDTTNDLSGTWDFKIYDGVQDITIFTINKNTGLASIASADALFEIAKISEDSVGPILRLLKERTANNGQTLIGDTVGEVQFQGTRDDGVDTLVARVKSLATNNTTATQKGAYLAFEIVPLNGASLIEVLRIEDQKIGINTQAPENALHVVGDGARLERAIDSGLGASLIVRKKRVSGVGQVQNGDILGTVGFNSTDDAGAEVSGLKIEVTARENHTSSAQGTKASIQNKRLGQSVYTEQITIEEDVNVKTNLVVEGNLTVQGTTTSINSTTMDVEDSNITLNKGGNQASANTNKSGITVEMSDATDARLGYDSTKASKFVAGEVGAEEELVTVNHTQTLTAKTLTGANIQSPVRLDVKKDIEANLVTYALTATNGQWCFATDTKVMYQVIDTELVPAGAGGGGVSLKWNSSGLAPLMEFVDGFELANFTNEFTQELFAILAVPNSYQAGKQIKLKAGKFFTSVTTGNVRMRAATALINSSTVFGTYSNIHTSVNTQVAVAGVADTITDVGEIDITDASGLINGVAVNPGDKLRIRLFRDTATETSGALGNARAIVDSFEPTFS